MDPFSTIFVNDGSCSAGKVLKVKGAPKKQAAHEELCAAERHYGRYVLQLTKIAPRRALVSLDR